MEGRPETTAPFGVNIMAVVDGPLAAGEKLSLLETITPVFSYC